MTHMIVTVNKLNRRSSPINNVGDKSNIVDTVNRGFSFDSTEQTNNAAGTWYKDSFNLYYWAGGLAADISAIPATNAVTTPTATTVAIASLGVLTTVSKTLLNPPQIVPH